MNTSQCVSNINITLFSFLAYIYLIIVLYYLLVFLDIIYLRVSLQKIPHCTALYGKKLSDCPVANDVNNSRICYRTDAVVCFYCIILLVFYPCALLRGNSVRSFFFFLLFNETLFYFVCYCQTLHVTCQQVCNAYGNMILIYLFTFL